MGLAKIVRVDGRWSHLLYRPGMRSLSLWLVHGLGDWSAAWHEALEHPALAGWDLYVPDLPGFGRTPPEPGQPAGLTRLAGHLDALVRECASGSRVVLVGHSMGGAIGTLLAEARPEWMAGLVNIEGNLTEDDCTISSRALAAADFARWYGKFADMVFQEGREERGLRHYHAGLLLADRATFLAAARDLVELSAGGELGRRYAALDVPRIYFHGAKEFPERSLALLEETGMEREVFEAGHWVMGDAADAVYSRLARWAEALEAPRR